MTDITKLIKLKEEQVFVYEPTYNDPTNIYYSPEDNLLLLSQKQSSGLVLVTITEVDKKKKAIYTKSVNYYFVGEL